MHRNSQSAIRIVGRLKLTLLFETNFFKPPAARHGKLYGYITLQKYAGGMQLIFWRSVLLFSIILIRSGSVSAGEFWRIGKATIFSKSLARVSAISWGRAIFSQNLSDIAWRMRIEISLASNLRISSATKCSVSLRYLDLKLLCNFLINSTFIESLADSFKSSTSWRVNSAFSLYDII